MSECFRIEEILIPRSNRILLKDTFLPLEGGRITGIYGRTGSGKSTLMRVMAGIETAYTFELKISARWEPAGFYQETLNSIGFIEQSPRDNLITRKVNDELLFSLQSAGLTEEECNEKLDHLSQMFNIASLRERSTLELSEGQAQKIAIVEALSRECKLLLLDEPTAHLDEDSKQTFVSTLQEVASNKPDCRIVLSSHDTKLLSTLCNSIYEIRDESLVQVPSCSVRETEVESAFARKLEGQGVPVLTVKDLTYSYGATRVLDGISFEIKKGDRVAIRGPNGSGKSTLLRLLTGLIRKGYKGKIEVQGVDIKELADIWPGVLYLSMQDPNKQILLSSVREEFEINSLFWDQEFLPPSLENLGISEIFDKWNMSLDDMTFSLSYGQKRVLSLMPIFFRKPRIVLLDEPFAGLDHELSQRFIDILDLLSEAGVTLCLTGHDQHLLDNCNLRTIELPGQVEK